MKRLWNILPRWVRIALILLGSTTLFIAVATAGTWWYFHPTVTRTDGVVYGERHGHDLTMDVIRPNHPNGLGVALMVSGSWKSSGPGSTSTWMMAPVLRRGYTVFAVCHVSQPEATVMEIIEDVSRGVRFIRHHADRYGIDPDRIGATGGSAGGHLSLMLATRGGPGPADATDPVDRESSAVQAVAIFFPVTDLLHLGKSTENPGDGGPPKSYVKAFGPQATDMAAWQQIGRATSPIYHVTSGLPPILIYHGDADTLTPLEQSEWFRDRAREVGRDVELVVHPGGQHGWLTIVLDIRKFADWFDRHLRSAKQ
jgi:acetyl esterase/lipase